VPGALHVVGEQMVTDTVIVENLGDVLSVGDERPRPKDRSPDTAVYGFDASLSKVCT